MRIRARVIAVIAAVAAVPLAAQEAVPSPLSLADALEIARGNNPSFLQIRNDEALADWDVRQDGVPLTVEGGGSGESPC